MSVDYSKFTRCVHCRWHTRDDSKVNSAHRHQCRNPEVMRKLAIAVVADIPRWTSTIRARSEVYCGLAGRYFERPEDFGKGSPSDALRAGIRSPWPRVRRWLRFWRRGP